MLIGFIMDYPAKLPPSVGIVPSGDFKRVGAFQGIRRLIRECGGDPADLFKAFGIEIHLFDDVDNYVYYPSIIRLLEHCAKIFDRPHFGLEIGSHHNVENLGPMSMVMLSSDSVRQALSYVRRYICIHSPGGMADLEVIGGQASLNYRVINPAMAAFRQVNELSMAIAFRVIEGLAGRGLTITEVHIASDKPATGRQQIERFFGAPVLYRQTTNSLVFAKRVLDLPVAGDSSSTLRFARQYLDSIAVDRSNELISTVENIVVCLLPLECCTLDMVARQLGLGPRNLQAKLQAAGEDFRSIVRYQREQLAKAYLRSTSTPISEIANLLGFSDQAVFTRAFSAWAGLSPGRYRAGSAANVRTKAASVHPQFLLA